MSTARNSEILWLEPDDNRCKPYATMKPDGVLCFGQEMRSKLQGKIKIGFLVNECAIIVETGIAKGFVLPKTGEIRMIAIAQHLIKLGIDLPVHFLFSEEKKDSQWIGYVIPPPRKPGIQPVKKAVFRPEQADIIKAYDWLIEKAVRQYAKSTPIEERRATARSAFIEAICAYRPVNGQLKDYLAEQIKTRLIEHNRQYTRISRYNSTSLNNPDNCDCLLWLHARNEIAIVDDKAEMDNFCKTCLTADEAKILRMLNDGYLVAEITKKYGITEQELSDICTSIGERWTQFGQTDKVA